MPMKVRGQFVKLRAIRDVQLGDIVFVVADGADQAAMDEMHGVLTDLAPGVNYVVSNFVPTVKVMKRAEVEGLYEALKDILYPPPKKRKQVSRAQLLFKGTGSRN